MGVVYRARDARLGREVALKMALQPFPSEADQKRFRTEAETIAALDHPNIVPIYEVGDADGQPFYAMKFVKGGNLSQMLARHSRPFGNFQSIARFTAKIARATHHAHQRGVIHRDIKPSNILLDEHGEPLLSDFGLAKFTEARSNLTITGAAMGTPAYSAPEQALGSREITIAADVYSIGAILYELLAGIAPFTGGSALDILRKVVEIEPVRPSLAHPEVPRDLETICLKCLQKESRQRYGSAEALAEDLERWLAREPIQARPAGPVERFSKWCARRPALAGLALAALLAPAAIIGILLYAQGSMRQERNLAQAQEIKAKTAEAKALSARAEIRENLYAADLLLANRAAADGNLAFARQVVESYAPPSRSQAANESQLPDLRGFEWRRLWRQTRGDPAMVLRGHSNTVNCLDLSRDGQSAISAGGDGAIICWDLNSLAPLWRLSSPGQEIQTIKLSGDRRYVAAGRSDGSIELWDTAEKKKIWSFGGAKPPRVFFSRNRLLVYAKDAAASGQNLVQMIEISSGSLLQTWPGDLEAVSRDERIMSLSDNSPKIELWDLADGRKTASWLGAPCNMMALSPGGGKAAACTFHRDGFLICETGHETGGIFIKERQGSINTMTFSPDGSILATGGNDQTIHLWDAGAFSSSRRLAGHAGPVTGLAFSPDQKRLFSSSADGTIRGWDLQDQGSTNISIPNLCPPYLLSPDGTKLAAGSIDSNSKELRRLHVWDLKTMRSVTLGNPAAEIILESFSPDGKTLWTRKPAMEHGAAALQGWDLEHPGAPPFKKRFDMASTGMVVRSAISWAGGWYAIAQYGGPSIQLFDFGSARRVGQFLHASNSYMGEPALFTPDGLRLLTYAPSEQLLLLNPANPAEIIQAPRFEARIFLGPFSWNGSLLAVLCEDFSVRILETKSLRQIAALRGHQQNVSCAAFSHDGKTIATASSGGVIKLWSWPSGREASTFFGPTDYVYLAFTAEDRALVAGGWSEATIFAAPSLAEIDAAPPAAAGP
jgi:WD40 repeat protein